MLEAKIEKILFKLKKRGFLVYKFKLPGIIGGMDRMIIPPKWSPGPPIFVECKRPKGEPRPLQEARRNDWLARGLDVRPHVNSQEGAAALIDQLIREAWGRAR